MVEGDGEGLGVGGEFFVESGLLLEVLSSNDFFFEDSTEEAGKEGAVGGKRGERGHVVLKDELGGCG